MSGKGSRQRPGEGYAEGWDVIFGKKEPEINPMTGCMCSFRQRMLGDGCDICNPEEAARLAAENVQDDEED